MKTNVAAADWDSDAEEDDDESDDDEAAAACRVANFADRGREWFWEKESPRTVL